MLKTVDWATLKPTQRNVYYGIVEDRNDPLKNNAVRVRVPYLHDGVPTEYLPFFRSELSANNSSSSSEVNVPPMGSKVKVKFENDDFYNGTYSTCEHDPNNIDSEFMQDYPNFKGWKTASGNEFKANDNGTWTFKNKYGQTFQITPDSIIQTATNIKLIGATSVTGTLKVSTGATGTFKSEGNAQTISVVDGIVTSIA